MPSLAIQAISLKLLLKDLMPNRNKSLGNTFPVMLAIFLEFNLRTYLVRLTVKLVLPLQMVP